MTPEDCTTRHEPLPIAHGPGHDHAHDIGHGHVHAHGRGLHRPRQRRALLLCIALTVAMMAAEIAGSLWTGSLMLLSDAAHMLSHALALSVSYVALRLATRDRHVRSHFGMYRTEILGAFLNGLGVLAFTAFIVYEAFERLQIETPILGGEMTLIAVLGLVTNLVTAVILARAGTHDLNTRSAYLHMLGDTLSSVAIVAGGGVLWATGWNWIDPVLSVLVAIVIFVWGFGLLRESTAILLEFAPVGADPDTVRQALIDGVPAILDVHDMHVWEITSGYVCMTAHVVVDDCRISETGDVHAAVAALVRERFHVGHVTLQLESSGAAGASG